jgi:hypothetical protein
VRYAAAALRSIVDDLAAMGPGSRNNDLYRKACRLGTMVGQSWIERSAVEAQLYAAMAANGYIGEEGRAATWKTLQSGLGDGLEIAAREPARPVTSPTGNDAATPPKPLQWLDMSNWDNEPVPERQWAIRDRVPLNQCGLFSGEGGGGKSIIELMKDVAHVAGMARLNAGNGTGVLSRRRG